MAGRAYAINREQADIVVNMVEGTILVDSRPAIALFDFGSSHSFVAPVFACNMQNRIMQLPYNFTELFP